MGWILVRARGAEPPDVPEPDIGKTLLQWLWDQNWGGVVQGTKIAAIPMLGDMIPVCPSIREPSASQADLRTTLEPDVPDLVQPYLRGDPKGAQKDAKTVATAGGDQPYCHWDALRWKPEAQRGRERER